MASADFSTFGQTLIRIRGELGFKSARAFYLHLSEKTALNFNYPYYARIESSKVLPSAKVVSILGALVTERHSDWLVKAYFAELFPEKTYLLKPLKELIPIKSHDQSERGSGATVKQVYLNAKQVSALSRTRTHYYLFLLLALARAPISVSEARGVLADSGMEAALHDLQAAKLVGREGSSIWSLSRDLRFPKDETDSMKGIFRQLDAWDAELDERFSFSQPVKKVFLRRVSSSFAALLLNHCDLLLSLFRTTEETEMKYRENVMVLQLKVSQGKLPG